MAAGARTGRGGWRDHRPDYPQPHLRYHDAPHVDLGSFYARRPAQGRVYRLFGYAACLGVLVYAADPARTGALVVVVVVAWVMAWRREVGAVWRSSLVAAILMGAVLLTCARLGHPLVQPVQQAGTCHFGEGVLP